MIDVNNAASYGLDARQAEMVNLIERRFNRAAIAAYMGISTQTVRDVIGGMCDHYGCPAQDLPARVLQAPPSEIFPTQ
jgi:hypothetical protein